MSCPSGAFQPEIDSCVLFMCLNTAWGHQPRPVLGPMPSFPNGAQSLSFLFSDGCVGGDLVSCLGLGLKNQTPCPSHLTRCKTHSRDASITSACSDLSTGSHLTPFSHTFYSYDLTTQPHLPMASISHDVTL
eukprot:scaffold32484_cov21-Tisochrysis_lutea.AAC.1